MLYHSRCIIQDATPKIVDALLTLIFRLRMDHVAFSFAHQGCQYVDFRYLRANGIPMDLLTRPKTVDTPLTLRWHSIDAHFQNVPVTVSISLLPVQAAHTLFMNNSKQISFQLTYLPQQISLTHCWRSVSECGCYHAAVSFGYKGCQSVDYE
jgi:hypothetical protein